MKILITGGAGYIGTELVRHLTALPQVSHIVVYDNLSRANYNLFIGHQMETDKVQFVMGDLLDSRKLRKLLKDIDVVFHLAAKVTTPFDNTDSHFFEQVNHWGTAELVYALEESDVKKFIFTSSSAVYGSSQELLDESATTHPETFYGVSKLRGESHVQRIFGSKNALILRCGNVYGYSPSMRFDSVVNRFMFDANFNNRISIHGNGRQHRTFIHIDRLVHILAQTALLDVPSGTYNLTEKNIQLLDLVEVMREVFPSLEFLFINQHLSMQEIQLNPHGRLSQYIPQLPESDLKDELIRFKEKFAFSSVTPGQRDKAIGQGI
jgi:UDP-glucose 4-epimerase